MTPDPRDGSTPPRRPARGVRFAMLCAGCAVVAVGYLGLVLWRDRLDAAAPPAGRVEMAGTPAALGGGPSLFFRSMARGPAFGRVATAPLDAPDGPRSLSDLDCERVYVGHGGGVCLASDHGTFVKQYRAELFGPDLRPGGVLPLEGIPSRARLSPDGRTASVTMFVRGDTYLDPGSFSTRTLLIDTASGTQSANLEEFAVERDGQPFKAADFNFWGVTFAKDGNRFYATLATGNKTYLIDGDAAARTARVLRENVECPSLSPDNRRIVYKNRVGPNGWRLHVLDLETGADRPLGETRSIDDQAEWLDDRTVAYAVRETARPEAGVAVKAGRWGPAAFAQVVGRPKADETTNVWAAPIGGGAPRLLVPHAYSPAVVR